MWARSLDVCHWRDVASGRVRSRNANSFVDVKYSKTTTPCLEAIPQMWEKGRAQLEMGILSCVVTKMQNRNQGGRSIPTTWEESRVQLEMGILSCSHETGTKINCVWRQQIPGHGTKEGNFTKT